MRNFYYIALFLGFNLFVTAQTQDIDTTGTEGTITPITRISTPSKTINSTSQVNATTAQTATAMAAPAPTGTSTEVGITEGQLSVSLSGAANYAIPIAVPPGINGVVPQISLVYNSQSGNGVAGYGWNIAGVSAITRIPRTKFHDGFVGGVNLDANDRFALDGQRLILKSGTYGTAGAIYETENFSNIKITSVGVSPLGANYGPASFLVEYPDGSKAEYGSTTDSRSITTWAVTYWENAQGVRISYSYILNNNNLSIEYVKYGNTGTNSPINQVKFVYKARLRPEQSYVGGQSILIDNLLSEIQVLGNNEGFRNYVLTHLLADQTSLGYQRLSKITESSGDNLKSYNPTVFTYDTTTNSISYLDITTNTNLNSVNYLNSAVVSGDFGGDEGMDFIAYPITGSGAKTKYWFFSDIDAGYTNLGFEDNIGAFETIFPVSFLSNDNNVLKVFPKQGWSVVKKTNTNYTFSIFSRNILSANSKDYQYNRIVDFPTIVVWEKQLNPCNGLLMVNKMFPKKILSGDFNGDGLTDSVLIDTSLDSYSQQIACKSYTVTTIYSKKVYFVDLKRDNTANFLTYSGDLEFAITDTSKVEVADVNGDGKSDFLIFENGKVTVYTLNETNQLVVLWNYLDANISIDSNKIILLGDYNGDRKTDFIIPKGYGYSDWYKYSSIGNNFTKETQNYLGITFYQNIFTGAPANFIAFDYDKDGKSDLIELLGALNTTNGNASLGISCFYNNNGTFDYNKKVSADSGLSPDINIYALPIYLPTGKGVFSKGKPYNPTLEIAFLNNSKIFYFKSEKDHTKEQLLRTITTGNGVRESITYKPLSSESEGATGDPIYTYTPNNLTPIYPNRSIESASAMQVVTKLEKESTGVYKQQLFSYADGVSNLEGLGFLGFAASMRTNWFNDYDKIISSVSRFDPNLRGINTENYSYEGFVTIPGVLVNVPGVNTPRASAVTINNTRTATETIQATNTIIFDPGATIDPVPNNATFIAQTTPDYDANGYAETNTTPPYGLISKSLLFYESALSTSKVFNVKNTRTNTYNILENTSTETNIVYDANNNPLETVNKIRNGGIGEQTSTTTVAYTSSSTPYIVGMPTSKTETISNSGDSMTSKETYEYYTGTQSNLLKKVDKYGNNTGAITETNEYDAYGNITKKTIAAGLESRVTNYEYNPASPYNGRFLTKSTDVEGLSTTFAYNTSNGVLNSETNPYALTTTYLYDSWNKKTKTTDYLSNSNMYAYIRQTEKTKITQTGDDGSYSEELFDDLGRKIQTGIRDIQGNMSYKDFKYDIYDRNYSISEPYTGSPLLWNTTTYDVYGRPETVTDFTGKIMSMDYSMGPLTTKVTDSSTGNTKTSVRNAMGNVITMTEAPIGGTVNYTYFANGNLKETNYSGTKITMTQDGWGRKTSLTDASAGTYTYEYNELGEQTKETTPNGTTTYTLDHATGKLTGKTISGTNTNTSTVYTYNALPDNKLLAKTELTDAGDGNKKNTVVYTYDVLKRLISTKETNGYGAEFTKTIDYDDYGRVYIETNEAKLNGKTSTTSIQHDYTNGFASSMEDSSNTVVYWKTDKVNARGQLTEATLGNGIKINNTYDSSGFGYLTNTKHVLGTTTAMELTNDFALQRGNLNWRKNSLFGNVQENFTYDSQDRLLSYPNALGVPVTQSYKEDGRIDVNNAVGTYNYANTTKKYQNTSVTLNSEATGYYANREGVFDDSFEEQTGWAGANKYPSGTPFHSYDTTRKHSGNTSLKLTNTTTTEQYIYADKWVDINNAVDTQYTYSVWVYSENPDTQLFLAMKTAAGTITHDNVGTTVKNQWYLLTKTITVPANVKKLNIRLDNNNLGNVWFDDIKIRKTNNTALANLQVPDASYKDHQLNVTYNAFKSPYEIEETGVDKISFTYNDSNNRSAMFYGSLDTDKDLRPIHKYYSADGSMEIKQNINTGVIEFVTYIGGDGYSAPAVYKKTVDGTTTTEETLYLHRDYQGSIIAITNAAGTILEKRQFDAWGAIIKVQDGAGNVLNGLTILDRGYTGHEHLQSVGLIHMNGRLYDPKLHRFLQPDNYIQDPTNTQNFNRYGYVLNNPLKYTDPSGEKWKFNWADVGAGVAIVAGAVLCYFGQPYIGGALIVGGFTHFSTANNEYQQTGDWDTASNNAGLVFGVSVKTDWGYNSSKTNANGVYQSESAVNPKTDIDGGGKNDAKSQETMNWGNAVWHSTGPTLRFLGADIISKNSTFAKYLFPGSRVVGEASSTTSVASLALRRLLPINIGFRILGTTTLGGVGGRLVPIIGEGLMINDFTKYISIPMMEGFEANRAYNQRSGNWIANIPH